ncbi:uncharacterized protein BT62DRAFT_622987 [Guyanagaster necrorhizus]|uniref:Uncharacterized protein n=1 Tax=Guyanagaster necrorhizus TaxID=856835 RepID=A0A9P7W010_9AGAR|nr:uncharacterized protein BT62DRAFT_622987 [Guyanagaster necrorhizus MCA 3950]KAG7450084.1 hypothetical protein BT62DRAFT_622987 [Guyanagaster necrorhizus MCA 3950]
MTAPQPVNAYILALPNELLEEALSPEVREERHYDNTKIGIVTLCSVSKRFRDIFLRHLYRTIRYHDIRNVRPFLDVLRFRDVQYVVHLDLVLHPILCVPGYDLLSMLDLLLLSLPKLEVLQSLRLDIRPTPRDLEDSYPTAISVVERAPADVVHLSPEVVNTLNSVFQSLPQPLRSLSLSGFCLEDATAGLAATKFPSLRTLSLDLNGTGDPYIVNSRHFLRGMPRLESIDLPVQWCPRRTLFRRVFAGRKFKHIKIGFTGQMRMSDTDTHEDHACPWNRCIVGLLQQSSSILTSLNIGTISLIIPRKVAFPALTSLTLLDIEFGFNAGKELQGLLAPFLSSPLETLEILECHDLPAVLVGLIDTHWPKLRKLSVSELTTVKDEYDPPDLYPYSRCLGDDAAWDAETRRELEAICEHRGVGAWLDWGYADLPWRD